MLTKERKEFLLRWRADELAAKQGCELRIRKIDELLAEPSTETQANSALLLSNQSEPGAVTVAAGPASIKAAALSVLPAMKENFTSADVFTQVRTQYSESEYPNLGKSPSDYSDALWQLSRDGRIHPTGKIGRLKTFSLIAPDRPVEPST